MFNKIEYRLTLMKRRFFSLNNTFFLLFLCSLSHIALAQCLKSEPIVFFEVYEGCSIRFIVSDQKTGDSLIKDTLYASEFLSQSVCGQFCDRYNALVSPLEVKGSGNNPGMTNTVETYGIYDGNLDITEAFGAFDDLMQLGLLRRETRNLDLGGGKFDHATVYLSNFGIDNFVYDPFGRDDEHNERVLSLDAFDTVSSISILNVIMDSDLREQHLRLAHDKVKFGGLVLFKIYEGDGSGFVQDASYQMNAKTEVYLEEIARVFGLENIKLYSANKLIVAQKPAKISKIPFLPTSANRFGEVPF